VQSEFGTDVFGFGLYIYKHKHKMWNDVKENWNDYFKEIEVDVNSSIKIRQSGLTRDTIKKGDKH
jgi:spore germination protein KC